MNSGGERAQWCKMLEDGQRVSAGTVGQCPSSDYEISPRFPLSLRVKESGTRGQGRRLRTSEWAYGWKQGRFHTLKWRGLCLEGALEGG